MSHEFRGRSRSFWRGRGRSNGFGGRRDERRDERSFGKRRRGEMEVDAFDPAADRRGRVKMLLALVGEHSQSDLRDNLVSLAQELCKDLKFDSDFIVGALFDCVANIRVKVPIYATLAALMSNTSESFGTRLVSTLAKELQIALLPNCLPSFASADADSVWRQLSTRLSLLPEVEGAAVDWLPSDAALDARRVLTMDTVIGTSAVSGVRRHKNEQSSDSPSVAVFSGERMTDDWPRVELQLDRARVLLEFGCCLAECGVVRAVDVFAVLSLLIERIVLCEDIAEVLKEHIAFIVVWSFAISAKRFAKDEEIAAKLKSQLTVGGGEGKRTLADYMQNEYLAKRSGSALPDAASTHGRAFVLGPKSRAAMTPLCDLWADVKRLLKDDLQLDTGDKAPEDASDTPVVASDFVDEDTGRKWHIATMSAPWHLVADKLTAAPSPCRFALRFWFNLSGFSLRIAPVWKYFGIPALVSQKLSKNLRVARSKVDLVHVSQRIVDTLRAFASSPTLCCSQLTGTLPKIIDSAFVSNSSAEAESESSTFGCQFLIVEAIFGGLLQLPYDCSAAATVEISLGSERGKERKVAPPNIAWIYYGRVLVELFKQSPEKWPRLVGPVVNWLFTERLPWVDAEACDRLAKWFAFHLSNFSFQWPWASWGLLLAKAPAAAEPMAEEPSSVFAWKLRHATGGLAQWRQYVFVETLLRECLSLTYAEKLAEVLPEFMRSLLPTQSAAMAVVAQRASEKCTDASAVRSLTEMLERRQTVEEVRAHLLRTAKPLAGDRVLSNGAQLTVGSASDLDALLSLCTLSLDASQQSAAQNAFQTCAVLFASLLDAGKSSITHLMSNIQVYGTQMLKPALSELKILKVAVGADMAIEGTAVADCFPSTLCVAQCRDGAFEVRLDVLAQLRMLVAVEQLWSASPVLKETVVDKLHASAYLSPIAVVKFGFMICAPQFELSTGDSQPTLALLRPWPWNVLFQAVSRVAKTCINLRKGVVKMEHKLQKAKQKLEQMQAEKSTVVSSEVVAADFDAPKADSQLPEMESLKRALQSSGRDLELLKTRAQMQSQLRRSVLLAVFKEFANLLLACERHSFPRVAATVVDTDSGIAQMDDDALMSEDFVDKKASVKSLPKPPRGDLAKCLALDAVLSRFRAFTRAFPLRSRALETEVDSIMTEALDATVSQKEMLQIWQRSKLL